MLSAVIGTVGGTAATASLSLPGLTFPPGLGSLGSLGSLLGGSSTPTGWQSVNWSGYVDTAAGPYTSVSASWTVPTATGTSPAYSATWVGEDGWNNSQGTNDFSAGAAGYPLIQAGTEQNSTYTNAQYYSWWVISSSAANQGDYTGTVVPEPVNPGDEMTVALCEVGVRGCKEATPGSATFASDGCVQGSAAPCWTITEKDGTEGWTAAESSDYSGPGSAADYVMEAPGGSPSSMAQYSTFAFDLCTTNGANPGLTPAMAGTLTQSSSGILGPTYTTYSTPSAPDADSDGFAMAYGSTAPSAPAS